MKKVRNTLEKKSFLNKSRLLLSARKKILKSWLFPINLDKILTHQPTPERAAEPVKEPATEPSPKVATEPATEATKHKKYKFKLQKEIMNEIIANEKDIND